MRPRPSPPRHAFPLATALIAASLLAAAPASAAPAFEPEPPARAAGAPAQPAAPAPAPPPGSGPIEQRLSDEQRLSRWAYVERATTARAAPSASARPVKRLATQTFERSPELVLLLAERTGADGRQWVRARLPMRPVGSTGWVPREALGAFRTNTKLLRIDRRRLRATLYRSGRPVWSARVGVGLRRWPTPAGRFYVRERLIPRSKNGVFGVFAFGTSGFSNTLTDWPGGGQVGIHGTNQPDILPGRVSHGCVRLRNADINRLRRLMDVGTPIHIR